MHDSSLFAADIVMLLWSRILHNVCVSLAQPPTLPHQQPCAVVSLASNSLVWSHWTAPTSASAPQLHLFQQLFHDCICFSLLLLDCVRFSWCSSSESASCLYMYHTYAAQSIISRSMKVAHHYCSPTARNSHFRHTQTHTFTNIHVTRCKFTQASCSYM